MSASKSELNQYIQLEQTKALYNNLTIVLIGSLGVTLATTWVFWPVADRSYVTFWLIAGLSLNFLRWLTSHRFDPNETDPRVVKYYLNLHAFWGFLNSTHWGLVPLLFLTPEVTVYTLFVTSVHTGFVSSAMSTDTAYFRSFFAFALPSSLTFIARALYEGGELYYALAALVLLFIVMLSYLSLNAQKFFKEARELNYRNMKLMGELRVQKETAEKATVAKDRFLAAASHDIRQPLNAASLFVDALDEMKIEELGRKTVGKIRHSLRALNGMLHGILDISRLDSSSVENHPAHFYLNDTVDQLIAEYSYAANRKGIELTSSIRENSVAYVDQLLITRVIRNVLDNAIKYTNMGSVKLTSQSSETAIELTITDTGIGIPCDQQDDVFDEFTQLNNPERDRQKGLGLGLAIVKRICDLLDVDIALESEVDSGTSVTLVIPKGDDQKVELSVTAPSTDFENLDVVVVDDEYDILEGMSQVLSTWKCKVTAAESLAQAKSELLAKKVTPALIISDLRLRNNENGIDLIEDLREEFNLDIPAILITGDTAPDRVKTAQESDVTVLYKPIESHDLKAAMHDVLNSSD